METLLEAPKKDIGQHENKTVIQLHQDTNILGSQLKFTLFELNFTINLIDSYAFEPKTANSFLLLEEFKSQTEKLRVENKELQEQIKKHENALGGIFECINSPCDTTYYQSHEQLETTIQNHIRNFESMKVEIFNYCENILRGNKKP